MRESKRGGGKEANEEVEIGGGKRWEGRRK